MKKKFIIVLLLCLFVFTGCKTDKSDPYSGPYGKRIKEDLTTTNIIDDNYRNYYEIFVPAFNDSNYDGIGDLKGVTNRLDYLKDLGYNGIWLMPIHPATSYHRYDVSDYFAVDSKLGTLEDLKELISECHERGIKLIIDLVLNHSSKSCNYYKLATAAYDKAQKGETLSEQEQIYQDFYVFYPSKAMAPSNITVAKAGSNYDFYVEANFSDNMPEFNFDNPYVIKEFEKIVKYYLDMGIDGFRLDAVKYYYKNSQEKNIDYLAKLSKYVKSINANAYIVGECWDSNPTITKYYESGIDSFFNFSISTSSSTSGVLNGVNPEGRGIKSYYNALIANQDICGNQTGIPAPFIDNHDMPRYTYISNQQNNKFIFGLLTMMNGTLFSYYGDECGLYGSNASNKPDQNVRLPIKWGDFTTLDCNPILGYTEINYPFASVFDQLKDSNSIVNYYKKALLIRNQNPEIARGTISLVELDKETKCMLFISKTYNGSEIGIVINFSQYDDLTLNIKEYSYSKVVGQIVVDSSQYVGELKNGSIKMPPLSIVILKK